MLCDRKEYSVRPTVAKIFSSKQKQNKRTEKLSQSRQNGKGCCFDADESEEEVWTVQPRSRNPIPAKKNQRPLILQEDSTISFTVNGKAITGNFVFHSGHYSCSLNCSWSLEITLAVSGCNRYVLSVEVYF